METVITIETDPAYSPDVLFTIGFAGGGGLPTQLNVPQSHPAFTRRFEEYVPNSAGGRHKWKNWEHYIRSATINDRSCRYDETMQYSGNPWPYLGKPYLTPLWSSINDGFGTIDNPTIGLDQLYVKRLTDNGFVPEPSNLSDLKQSALSAILPKVKAELSLLNSIYELKDFKSLPSMLTTLSTLPAKGLLTARELSRRLASAHLFNEFALKPLLSDISKIRLALARTQRRINDLVTREGRVQKRHFSVPLPTQVGARDVSIFHTISTGPVHGFYRSAEAMNVRWRSARTVMFDSYKFHAEIEYNYNFTQYQIVHAQLLGFLDSFGLNSDPRIIWNALPWSFVIDWVFGVNRWLSQFQTGFMDPQVNIRRCLWSVVRDRTLISSIELRPSTPNSSAVTPERPVVTVIERSYRRNVFMPTTNSVELSGLNLKEFSLGAALVIARKWRRTKR
jgi:hypothetical protein